MKRWSADIRLWLLVVLLIRLWGITSPPLEASHSWRQSFTNMVSRNLAEGPFDLLHPRTDMAGERPDVVASEFPGFNAIIAFLLRLFGPAHWYGRLVALIISTLGAWAFHGLLQRRYNARVAFIATFILLWSAWFLYGRKSMPDTFSAGLLLISLFAVDRFIHRGAWRWLLLAVPLAALGGLCKIPAVVLLAPWGLMALEKGLPTKIRMGLFAGLGLALAPVLWWYFHWQPHLLDTYGNALYFPRSLAEGWDGLVEYRAKLLERFTFSALMSHVAFVAMLFGIWRSIRSGDRATGLVSVCIALPFGYFILKAGDVFSLHAYYILPLVPLMALLAALGLAALPSGAWNRVALFLVAAEAMGLRWSDLSGGAERAYLLRAETLADAHTMPDALVATASGLDPRPMYYLDRQGWVLAPEQALDPGHLDSLAGLGLKAVFVERSVLDQALPWELLHEDQDWRVYGPPDH